MEEAQFVPIEALGKKFSVSLATIRTWVRHGYIPKSAYIKIGNTYRFDANAVVIALTASPDDELGAEVAVKSAVPTQTDKPVVESPVQLELNFNPDEDL